MRKSFILSLLIGVLFTFLLTAQHLIANQDGNKTSGARSEAIYRGKASNNAPDLVVSKKYMFFDNSSDGVTETFTVSANQSAADITLTAPTGIILSKTTLTPAEAQAGTTITATYNNSVSIPAANIVVTNGTLTENILIDAAKDNLVGSWDANGSTDATASLPTASGWVLNGATGSVVWTPANVGTIGSIRYIDSPIGYTYKSISYKGRVLITRWDGTYTNKAIYSLPVTLTAGKTYLCKAKYAWNSNGTSPTITARVNSAIDNSGETYGTSSVSTGAVGVLTDGSFQFSVPQDGTYYVTFRATTNSIAAIADLSISEVSATLISIVGGTEDAVSSPTEGVINSNFVNETAMKGDLLQMLANFMTYVKNDFTDVTDNNSVGEACGYFKSENNAGSDEKGVRPNADLSMLCAFMYKYGKNKVTLPSGVTWDDVNNMARKSLIYAYSTHRANKLKTCSKGANDYWGSIDQWWYVWQSSGWASSVAYSAYFQNDSLTTAQKQYVATLIKAECNCQLNRTIPTGYIGDSKSEENGWDTNILACALGLYPNDALAPKWFERLRAFAINSYAHLNDATDATVIDPTYNTKTVKDLHIGKTIFDDYTLQNHNYFHTSYQNVVISELGESALSMKMFQNGINGSEVWKTNALIHNSQNVMNKVIIKLALADGELAMPNGNDWSMFLFDQIASYATMACFQKDPNALMLENLAYKNIKARQSTTADGSWLLRADVGARRMAVQARRVMLAWLMHEMASTASMTPTNWEDFRKANEKAEIFSEQNIVRASTKDRFTCFSWSPGIKSYTGYFTQNSPDKNKIIVPYKANNTGNILGWYLVSGQSTDATPVISGIYYLKGNSYTMNGVINTNGATLTNNFAIYSTPGNALIYLDYVKAISAVTITGARGGMLAISTDELTKLQRTIYHGGGRYQTNGAAMVNFATSWANIDNQIGIVTPGMSSMAFGGRAANNSIFTANFYPLYSTASRTLAVDDVVDRRQVIYYSGISATKTQELAGNAISLRDSLPNGWNGVIATDPDNIRYMLVSNFVGATTADMKAMSFPEGAPVFSVPTDISAGKSTAHFTLNTSHSVANTLRVFVTSGTVLAQQGTDSTSTYLTNSTSSVKDIGLMVVTANGKISGTVNVPANSRILVTIVNGQFVITYAPSTAVKQVVANESTPQNIYDINGRLLSSKKYTKTEALKHLKKGLYIIGSDKVLVQSM